jgi:PAS domain S-box-containing protein/putative nucleotidyltransferase with HDIG domain
MDKNGDMIYVSPSAEKMLGYQPEELMGDGWWRLSRIDSQGALPEKELLREIATGKGTVSSDPYVRAILTRDGRQIWIEWQDALGPNETVIGVGRDVTERKQMESELFSLSKFPSENPNPILRFDRDVRLLYSNEAAQKVFGVSEKDELVIPPQMLDVVKQVVDSGEQIKTEITYKEKVFTVYCIPISGKNYINVYGWDITEKKIAEDRVIRQLDQLKVLSEIDRIILSSFDLNLNLDLLLKKAVEQLGVDAGNIMLFDRVAQRLVSVRGTGFRTASFVGRSVELGEGNAGLVAQKRQPVQVDDLHGQTGNPRLARALLGEGFISYYGVPLIAKAEVRGVLELFHRGPLPLSSEWLDLVNAFAGRVAIAIDTIQAFETLQRSQLELTLSYEAAIEGWSRALDLRDKEPGGRSQRVATRAVELARRMGVKGEDLVNLARGALLHDIGKMSVPDDILFKKGELTEEERGVMRQHPSYARDMLEAIGYLRDAIDIPYAHHEHWDGSGYPRGLRGPQIPLAARIFAVADAFDALTHDRPDGAAVSAGEALSYIEEQSGKLFDPAVVQTFLELM